MSDKTITAEDIKAAQTRIAGQVERTPFTRSATLSSVLEAEVFIKFENLQFTASFKERGALNKLLSMSDTERAAGVIAISAGNHAQGVAFNAKRLGVPATIVMPETTPFTKVSHTRAFGARVELVGETIADGMAELERIQARDGLTFIHPFDDDSIIAGQGTVALEMLEDVPDLEMIASPIGGGGLISGMAIAAKAHNPNISVIGAEAELYPSTFDALAGRSGDYKGITVAEGTAVKSPGKRNLEIIRDTVAEVVLATENEIERAIQLYFSVEKTVAEGAGALSLAAIMAKPDLFKGKRVGVVLSGGNIDARLMAMVIMRGLVRDGQLARIRLISADVPGQLARVAKVLADARANIVEVEHQRLLAEVALKSADLDITVEARDHDHVRDIMAALADAGFNAALLGDSA